VLSRPGPEIEEALCGEKKRLFFATTCKKQLQPHSNFTVHNKKLTINTRQSNVTKGDIYAPQPNDLLIT